MVGHRSSPFGATGSIAGVSDCSKRRSENRTIDTGFTRLTKRGADPRENLALHAILTLQDGSARVARRRPEPCALRTSHNLEGNAEQGRGLIVYNSLECRPSAFGRTSSC
jgi:hypothetical protein